MKIGDLLRSLRANKAISSSQTRGPATAPVIQDLIRFPYGPFRFRSRLSKRTDYLIAASTDLHNWSEIHRASCREDMMEYVDSAAFKFPFRFYRLLIGPRPSANVIGYASVALPPGFSMIANPFSGSQTVATAFTNWPEGTTLSRFDTRLFRLVENRVKDGKWTNQFEKLSPGEGAIFFNPTSDYKSVSFFGDVLQGQLSAPLPSGFSVRSSLVPQPGNLVDDLHFPISDGDVIHLFDRDQQKYVLHPFQEGKWTAGPAILGVGESFWVAKLNPGNWVQSVNVEGAGHGA